ncbi:hypothetical protein BGZ83_007863, partial [Gryganskiella cystojenkinii]
MTASRPKNNAQQHNNYHHQTFREPDGSLIRIPVVRNKTSGDNYIIWTDIEDCFPNVLRIQQNDIYIPKLRDENFYRVTPHGIRHHPDTILDVIYRDNVFVRSTVKSSKHAKEQELAAFTFDKLNELLESSEEHNGELQDDRHEDTSSNTSQEATILDQHQQQQSPLSQHKEPPQSQSTVAELELDDLDTSFEFSDEDMSLDRPITRFDMSVAQVSSNQPDESFSEDQEDVNDNEHDDETEEQVKNKEEGQDKAAAEEKDLEQVIDNERDPGVKGEPGEGKLTLESFLAMPFTMTDLAQASTDGEKPPVMEKFKEVLMAIEETDQPLAVQWQMVGTALSELVKNQKLATGQAITDLDLLDPSIIDAAFMGAISRATQQSMATSQQESTVVKDTTTTMPLEDKEEAQQHKSVIIPEANPVLELDHQQSKTTLLSEQGAAGTKLSDDNLSKELIDPDDEKELHLEAIRARVQDVMDRKYRWAESLAPKLFVPIVKNKTPSPSSGIDLVIRFCCDCGGLFDGHGQRPDDWHPHCVLGGTGKMSDNVTGVSRAIVKSGHLRTFLEAYGEYMMGIVEMFHYLDRGRRVLEGSSVDDEMSRDLLCSLEFLKTYGIPTSLDLLERNRHLSRNERIAKIPRIRPLDGVADFKHLLGFIDGGRPYMGMSMLLTNERDVRWVCVTHFHGVRLAENLNPVSLFSIHDDSSGTHIHYQMDAVGAVISTPERARVFYRSVVPTLEIAVIRFQLEWEDPTRDDFIELASAVSKTHAVAVTIEVDIVEDQASSISGFNKDSAGDNGLGRVLVAALENKNIEVFTFSAHTQDQIKKPFSFSTDELAVTEKEYSLATVAMFKRDVRTGLIDLRCKVRNINIEIVNGLRRAVRGFHHLSTLRLGIFNTPGEYTTIQFAGPEKVMKVEGAQIEDKDYKADSARSVVDFFARRGNVDEIHYASKLYGENLFLDARVIRTLRIPFSLAKDRERIRKFIKENQGLEKLFLENSEAMDDPSQVYESFKSLLTNHRRAHVMEVEQGRGIQRRVFLWTDFRDLDRFQVEIATFGNDDKMGPMLQRYTSAIASLTLNGGISEANATILEKSFRPKKIRGGMSTFKLKRVSVFDPHLGEPAGLEILKKVILRTEEIEHVWVGGRMPLSDGITRKYRAKNSNSRNNNSHLPHVAFAEFIIGLRAKITNLMIWGCEDGVHKFLTEMSRRPDDDAVEMVQLADLSIDVSTPDSNKDQTTSTGVVNATSTVGTGVMKESIMMYDWILSLLLYKSASNTTLFADTDRPVRLDLHRSRDVSVHTPTNPVSLIGEPGHGNASDNRDNKTFVLERCTRDAKENGSQDEDERVGIEPLTRLNWKGIRLREGPDWDMLLPL